MMVQDMMLDLHGFSTLEYGEKRSVKEDSKYPGLLNGHYLSCREEQSL